MTAGPVEAAVRTFVKGLGTLDARRTVASENAIRLGALMDLEEGSAAAAVSRELRLAMAGLDAVIQLAPAAGAPAAPVRADPVAQARDDVARKRQQRAERASGGL